MEKSVENSKKKNEEMKRIYREHMREIQHNPVNKRSLWLNFIAFFIPIWGIFAGFFNLAKRPRRAKSLFVTTVFGFIWQGLLLWFCYSCFFDYLGQICITMFG